MEYRLAKTLDSSGIFLSNRSHVNLLNSPLKDYINPGIGQATRLYSLYVPTYNLQPKFTIDKEGQKQEDFSSKQEGFGNVELEDQQEIVEEPKNDPEINLIKTNLSPNLQKNEPESVDLKRKLPMNEGIISSFQHPKIKVSKLNFPNSKETSYESDNVIIKKKKEENKKKQEKRLEHKFKVI